MKSQAKNACLALSLLALAVPPAGAQGVDAVIVTAARRYFLSLADARCHLLDPATAQALKGGYVQARNAAIRAGHDMSALSPYLAAAGGAARRVDCGAPQLASEAAVARSAFGAFAATPRLDLPGSRAAWHGDRTQGGTAMWRLVQYQKSDAVTAAFGLYGPLDDNRLAVMVSFADGAKPYSARLLLRDPDTASVGMINAAAYAVTAAPPPGFGDDIDSFPARAMREVTAPLAPVVKANFAGFSASGDYVGQQVGPQDALRFDFSTRAYPAIARLDPREDMVIEFDFSDGPRYMRFEVGDFITGLSYVGLPSPYGGGA